MHSTPHHTTLLHPGEIRWYRALSSPLWCLLPSSWCGTSRYASLWLVCLVIPAGTTIMAGKVRRGLCTAPTYLPWLDPPTDPLAPTTYLWLPFLACSLAPQSTIAPVRSTEPSLYLKSTTTISHNTITIKKSTPHPHPHPHPHPESLSQPPP